MTKQDIIDYALHTPENVNPRVLESMLNELGESSGEPSIEKETNFYLMEEFLGSELYNLFVEYYNAFDADSEIFDNAIQNLVAYIETLPFSLDNPCIVLSDEQFKKYKELPLVSIIQEYTDTDFVPGTGVEAQITCSAVDCINTTTIQEAYLDDKYYGWTTLYFYTSNIYITVTTQALFESTQE